jgi:DNA-directed RNA polymerase subunit RPC12/RpoP
MSIPEQATPYLTVAKQNYPTITKNGITNDSLQKYFTDSFNDICKAMALYKCWICVRCMELNKFSYGWGDKPNTCPKCGEKTVYEVATFNARASYVGEIFQWAFWLLLKNYYGITARPTSDTTRLYDLEIRPDVVIEAKGSPKYIINQDGTHSKLERAGMLRSDTEKKAFANAKKWSMQFPNGHFFVVTNALPPRLSGYRNSTVKAILDVTKKNQLESLIADFKAIGIVGAT